MRKKLETESQTSKADTEFWRHTRAQLKFPESPTHGAHQSHLRTEQSQSNCYGCSSLEPRLAPYGVGDRLALELGILGFLRPFPRLR